MQGIGGGGLFPMVHSTLNDLVPPRERARYFVFNSIVWTTASLLGPVLGGVFAEYLHWSMIFWLNVPLGIGTMLLLRQRLKSLPKPGADRHFDVPGGLLLMASAVVFLLFVTWGGVRYAWSSLEITLLGAATLMLVSIYVVRARRIAEPFLPLSVLRGSVVPYGIIGGAFAFGSNTGLVAFLPLYFQIAHKFSAAEAGFALVPFVISFVPGALIASFAMKRADYKWFPVAGLVLTAAALALLAFDRRGLVVSRGSRSCFASPASVRPDISDLDHRDPERGRRSARSAW